MKDDAVAPVIAVMLILAAVVTFLAVWNGVYVPSMKQSAEIGHIQNVESAFLHFSSDLGRTVSARQDYLTMSEPVQLGGGDFFLDTLRSSGSLSVQEEPKPVYYLALYDENDVIVGEVKGTLVNISYEPQGNFWQDQGYRWQYGYINVTKHRTLRSPLKHYNMTVVNNEFSSSGSLAIFAGSFGDTEYTVNQTLLQNTTPTTDNMFTFSQRAGNCSGIVLRAVSLSVSPDHQFVNSNGFGTLELKSSITTIPYYGVRKIAIGSGREPFGNATFRNWNASLAAISGICEKNILYHSESSGEDFSLYTVEQQVNPVNVTLNLVTIEVGAY
jgi:hypothetical protein